MWIPISLSLLGLVLIYLEFFLAGGLIAILGGASLVAGVAFFSIQEVSLIYKVLYFAATCGGCVISCQSAIWVLKRRKTNALMLSSSQEGFVASDLDPSLIGKEGEAVSDLKPSGHILIGEERYQALSDGNYIKKGTPIRIVKGRGTHYLVKEKKS